MSTPALGAHPDKPRRRAAHALLQSFFAPLTNVPGQGRVVRTQRRSSLNLQSRCLEPSTPYSLAYLTVVFGAAVAGLYRCLIEILSCEPAKSCLPLRLTYAASILRPSMIEDAEDVDAMPPTLSTWLGLHMSTIYHTSWRHSPSSSTAPVLTPSTLRLWVTD